MAVAHAHASESHTGAIGSISEASFNWQHDDPAATPAPKGVLIFVVNLVSNTDIVSSVTYNSVSVPKVTGAEAGDTTTEPGHVTTYFLGSGVSTTDPATVVVNRTNNTDELWAVAVTVTAAAGKDTDIHTAGIVLLQDDGTLAEQSVTDGSPGSNSVRYAAAFSGLPSFPPTGASSTALFDFDTGQQTAAVVRETTAGQGARNVGFASGTSDDRAVVHLAIKEISQSITIVCPAVNSTANIATVIPKIDIISISTAIATINSAVVEIRPFARIAISL
jgi:hypothetical protein